jgi:hypothetical protein
VGAGVWARGGDRDGRALLELAAARRDQLDRDDRDEARLIRLRITDERDDAFDVTAVAGVAHLEPHELRRAHDAADEHARRVARVTAGRDDGRAHLDGHEAPHLLGVDGRARIEHEDDGRVWRLGARPHAYARGARHDHRRERTPRDGEVELAPHEHRPPRPAAGAFGD